ncbi:MAG: Maf-like protein [Hyphomicrobiales bacterium]|nr:Maf-like protein [Hyphomicrobiales bacterium]
MQSIAISRTLWRGEPLVLASRSEGRARILRNACIPYSIVPSPINERSIEQGFSDSPAKLAALLAHAKAKSVSSGCPGRFVLGADQVLSIETEILHKSESRGEAISKLSMLSGREHCLHSAISLVRNEEILFEHVSTVVVKMADIDDATIEAYADLAGDALEKSVGGYEIEGPGSSLIERIDGDYFSVIGLPLLPLFTYCRRVGLIGANGSPP